MTVIVNEDFASGVGSFSAGTQVASEGASFDTGYLQVGASTTATRTFTALSQASGQNLRLDFWFRMSDSTTAADGSASHFIYLLPNSTVTSANSIATLELSRNTAAGASSSVWVLRYSDGTFKAITPSWWRLSSSWYKVSVVAKTATRKYDIYVNDRLWLREIASPNTSYSQIDRLVILGNTSAPNTGFDNVIVNDNVEEDGSAIKTAETTLISHDFTAGSGEIEDSTPDTDNRGIFSQKWQIPQSTSGVGGYTLGASGATPDASTNAQAFVRCLSDGVLEATFTAASTGDRYGGIQFRCWDGRGTGNGNENQLYQARYWSASGTPVAIFGPTSDSAFGTVASGSLSGVTISASDEWGLRIVCRGRYIWVYIRNITSAGAWQLQLSGPLLVSSDATGAVALIGEENAGPFISTSTGSVGTGNICKSFSFKGEMPSERTEVDVTDYQASMDWGYIGELYPQNAGETQSNLFWSKGIQTMHLAQNEPAMGRTIEHQQLYSGTHLMAFRQRGVLLCEDENKGEGEIYVTFLRRGIWIDDKVITKTTNRNFAPDHDYRPRYFEANGYRHCGATGAGTLAAHTAHHTWRTDRTGAPPHGYQALASFTSGNPCRITTIVGSISNVTSASCEMLHKNAGNGSPISCILANVPTTIIAATTYEVYRAYLIQAANGIALSDTDLTNFRDDVKTPATLTMTTGTAKTDASGDQNTDGFNERHGWYEITCSGGVAAWTLPVASGQKFYPAFRLNSHTVGSNPQVLIDSALTVAGTDYVWDDFGDGTGVLQVLSIKTANTTFSVLAAVRPPISFRRTRFFVGR